jgi:hypothetical protein
MNIIAITILSLALVVSMIFNGILWYYMGYNRRNLIEYLLEDRKQKAPYDYISACPKCNSMMIYPEGKCTNKDCNYQYINKEV